MQDAEPGHDELDRRWTAALQRAAGRVSLLTAPDGTVLRVSDSVRDLLGYTPDELTGRPLFDLYVDAMHAEYSRDGHVNGHDDLRSTVVDVGAVSRTARVRAKDGGVVVVESFPTPMRGDPEVRGVLIEWIAVPDRRFLTEAVEALALGVPPAESLPLIARLVESMFAHSEVGVADCESGRWEVVVRPSGRPPGPLAAALPPLHDPVWARPWFPLELLLPGHDDARPREVAAVPLRVADDGPPLGALLVLRPTVRHVSLFAAPAANLLQVAQRMAVLALAAARTRAELLAAAERDPLTGLVNRAGLARRAAELAGRGVDEVTVVLLDLDDFKRVNDRHGHEAGDAVLVESGRRIRRAVRACDLVCRYGGDEFVVLTGDPLDAGAWRRVQQGLLDALAQPVTLPYGAQLPARASLGMSTGAPADLTDLLRACDRQLYRNKRAGKQQVREPRGDTGFPDR